MLDKIKRLIEKQNFNPKFYAIIFNPFFIARKGLAKSILSVSSEISGNILDVGCGTKPYKNFFNCTDYIGLEFDTGIDSDKKAADFYYDGKTFPFSDQAFDSVICNQVLEHVFEPDRMLSEIHRVLKANGKLLITVPFIWDEHEQPFDYARYSSFGIKYLAEKNGFIVLKQLKSISDISAVFQMCSAYLYKISHNRKFLKWFFILFLIFPINLVGFILGKVFPNNYDLYLDNILVAQKS